jgi:hypothetical protein
MTKKITPYPKGKYPRTEEHRRKISESSKGRQPMLGKRHTEESKKKISESLTARQLYAPRDNKYPPKVCLTCGGEFRIHSPRDNEKARWCSRKCHAGRSSGKFTRADGYVSVKTETGWRGEHRVVMEKILGRKLKSPESVHHINGVKTDNSPENLELWTSHQPKGQRGHCPTCTCDKIN